MSASNRADRITKLVTALKKKFKPHKPTERPLFETLLYACLLENSTHESAEKSIEHLEKNYFDWNEVRVSTRRELAEALKPLNDPAEAADRLKRTLQSVFESVYAFDIESMKKQNLGQSVKQISSYDGVTPFVVAYVTQNALSGHAIPCNTGLMLSFLTFDLISEAEHKKGAVPGLERTIPKNKGVEVGSIMHQLGVEVGRNPYGQGARKLLTDIDPSCKSRLPKRPPKPSEKKPQEKPAAKKADKGKAEKAPAGKSKEKAAAKAAPKKADTKKAAAPKKATKKPAPAKKKAAKPAAKKTAKKPAKKKVAKKKVAKKTAKKPAKKKVAKKATKKPAKKKVAKKKTTKSKRKPR